MQEPISSGTYYLDVILKSKGTKALNRLHARSFSMNIVSMNAKELADVIEITADSKKMVPAFYEKNEGASTQIHREANRLVHNYVCSISTFADHSRNFMKRHYKGAKFHKDYDNEVARVFSLPECRFVRDLRNFIVHRGLPDSNMSMTMTNDPSGSGMASIETEIHYGTAAFRSWDGWTSGSKRFLEASDDKLTLKQIFDPHFKMMEEFNVWFEERFREHHEDDLNELSEMQQVMRDLEAAEGTV